MLIFQRLLTWLQFTGIKSLIRRGLSKESIGDREKAQSYVPHRQPKEKKRFNVARVFNEENFYRHEINCSSEARRNSSAIIKFGSFTKRSYFASSNPLYFIIYSSSSSMSQRHENGIMTGFGFTNFFNSFLHPSILQRVLEAILLLASQTITVADVGRERRSEMGIEKLAQCRRS